MESKVTLNFGKASHSGEIQCLYRILSNWIRTEQAILEVYEIHQNFLGLQWLKYIFWFCCSLRWTSPPLCAVIFIKIHTSFMLCLVPSTNSIANDYLLSGESHRNFFTSPRPLQKRKDVIVELQFCRVLRIIEESITLLEFGWSSESQTCFYAKLLTINPRLTVVFP